MLGRVARLWVHALLSLGLVFAIYPLMWIVATALSGRPPRGALPMPDTWSLGQFSALVSRTDKPSLFWEQAANSLVVALATAFVAVLLATPVGYALSRMSFVGKGAGVKVLLATQMFPGVASAVPLYLLLSKIHLLDTRLGLVLVYAATAVPFSIFQLRGAFDAVPIELEEAAWVEGATRFQSFMRVAVPLVRPAMFVTALFAFMSAYNEFILAATFLSREESYTLPVVLSGFVSEHRTEWGPFAAGAIVVSVPVMLVFYRVQKELLSGLTAGGIKG